MKTNNDVSKSDAMYHRAKAVIPGGIFGHYGFSVRETGPKFFSRSKGAYFWDIDENKYVDYMCAYGPMILGYNDPNVDKAVRNQLKNGNTVSLASPVMVELAETLVDMVTAADWALFGKNGGDSTALAAMIARAATGRKKIVKVTEGYHGVAAWMQKGRPGTIPADTEHVLEVAWNDAGGLQKLDASKLMTHLGSRLNDGLVKVAAAHDYDLIASGVPAMPYLRLANVARKTHFAWIDECVKRGVYLLGYHNHFLSTAHTEADLQHTWEVVDDAFTALGPARHQPEASAKYSEATRKSMASEYPSE